MPWSLGRLTFLLPRVDSPRSGIVLALCFLTHPRLANFGGHFANYFIFILTKPRNRVNMCDRESRLWNN